MKLAYVTCGVKHNKVYRRITVIITLKSSYYNIYVVQMRIRLSVCSQLASVKIEDKMLSFLMLLFSSGQTKDLKQELVVDRGTTNSFLFFPFTKCSICAFFTGSCRTRTTRGDCCVFPFIYRNRRYNRPTRINAKRPWCSLTSNYDKDKLFGYTGGRTRKRIREPAIVFSCFVCLFVC